MEYGDIDDELTWNRLRDHRPILAPLVEESIDRLLRSTRLAPDARVLDVGCGLGGWLLRALETYPTARGEGIDVSAMHVRAATEAAERRGMAGRARFHAADALEFTADGPFDLAICVGVSDAFGGLRSNLNYLRRFLKPGGLALIGEPFWEREPDEAALKALGHELHTFTDLRGTIDRTVAARWLPVYGHVSTVQEWDDFQWACVGALTQWGLDEGETRAGREILRYAMDYREAWLRGYRTVLGFVTLVLRPLPMWASSFAFRQPGW